MYSFVIKFPSHPSYITRDDRQAVTFEWFVEVAAGLPRTELLREGCLRTHGAAAVDQEIEHSRQAVPRLSRERRKYLKLYH